MKKEMKKETKKEMKKSYFNKVKELTKSPFYEPSKSFLPSLSILVLDILT